MIKQKESLSGLKESLNRQKCLNKEKESLNIDTKPEYSQKLERRSEKNVNWWKNVWIWTKKALTDKSEAKDKKKEEKTPEYTEKMFWYEVIKEKRKSLRIKKTIKETKECKKRKLDHQQNKRGS